MDLEVICQELILEKVPTVKIKKYNLAISDYNKAIELDPNNPFAFYNRGISYDRKGEYEEAIDQIPDLIDSIKNLPWDSILAASVLSATAIWKKQYKMAELISALEDDDLTNYLLDKINEY